MADFLPTDKSLEEIWEDLLRLHWDYLDTEENMEKLEMRKKLEGELRSFLCMVQHDRKFFLTETTHVLKQSIMKLDDFTAYKALIGFETISQYANNLFRKPWRKEYRCIKMYSGYYQHEVKANLIDCEKLFEAMGYALLPNQTLVLDGPICPDQVTNVSRDAMTAYVECQIMKQIFLGLTSMQLQTTWQDIFKYRESHIGSASQAIKAMAYAIQERRFRKEKQLQSETYFPPASGSLVCNSSCSPQTHPFIPSSSQIYSNCIHHLPSQTYPKLENGTCNTNNNNSNINNNNNNNNSNTNNNSNNMYNLMCPSNNNNNNNNNNGGSHQQSSNYQNFISASHPTIPHSKSLEHYHDTTGSGNVVLRHTRHSFDHPSTAINGAYDYVVNRSAGYDCLDGPNVPNVTVNGIGYRSNCGGISATDHPYNVSGNRYPLPANLSNQLAHNDHHHHHHHPQYAQIAGNMIVPTGTCTGCMNAQPILNSNNIYSNYNTGCCHQAVHYDYPTNCNNNNNNNLNHRSGAMHSQDYHDYNISQCDVHGNKYYGQVPHTSRSRTNEHHVNEFCDQPMGKSYYSQGDSKPASLRNGQINKNKINELSLSKQLKYMQNHPESLDIGNTYQHRDSSATRKSSMSSKKYIRNAELLGEYEDHLDTNDSRTSRASDFESFDSSNNLSNERGAGTDQSTSSKIQDGVGSYEAWNYVFQNIGKNGLNKTDRNGHDLTVQGLDLNSIQISENKRSRSIDNHVSGSVSTVKRETAKPSASTSTNRNVEKPKPESVQSKSAAKSAVSKAISKNSQNTVPVQKSTLKQPASSSTAEQNLYAKEMDDGFTTIVNKSKTGTLKKVLSKPLNGTTKKVNSLSIAPTATSLPVSVSPPAPAATSLAATVQATSNKTSRATRANASQSLSTSEWNCKHCTFLNPADLRICQMCYKSQDFIIDAQKASTCV